MRRAIPLMAIAILVLLPAATSEVYRHGTMPWPSTPALQAMDRYDVDLRPGDTLDADLRWWTNADAISWTDLDLFLSPPGGAPVPLLPPADPEGAAGWALRMADSLAMRADCSAFVARSVNHNPLERTVEQLRYTVPAHGAAGTYVLTVNGFLTAQESGQIFYRLRVAVEDAGGADITSAALHAHVQQSLAVRTSAHCQF